MNPRILLVNEEPATAWAIQRALRHDDVGLIPAAFASEADDCLRNQSIDVVIADQRFREDSGRPFMDWLERHHPETVRIMVSGKNDLRGLCRHSIRARSISPSFARGRMTPCA
ncbi:MAG: response regulator [Gammaproteobacteria bacterium]|nr:response regulator [Gammaproteobacteria bacterium]